MCYSGSVCWSTVGSTAICMKCWLLIKSNFHQLSLSGDCLLWGCREFNLNPYLHSCFCCLSLTLLLPMRVFKPITVVLQGATHLQEIKNFNCGFKWIPAMDAAGGRREGLKGFYIQFSARIARTPLAVQHTLANVYKQTTGFLSFVFFCNFFFFVVNKSQCALLPFNKTVKNLAAAALIIGSISNLNREC